MNNGGVMKISSSILRGLLLTAMVFLPLAGTAIVTDTGGDSVPNGDTQTQPPKTDQKMNQPTDNTFPSTQNPGDETSTGISAAGITFGIYYGYPYSYAPRYYYYKPYRFVPYNYFYPYRPFYPYRSFFYQHRW
jgi:hypothetical protein